MNIPEKIFFLESDFFMKTANSSEKELNNYLSGVISDQNENSYVQKLSIGRLMDLVFLGKLKPRQALMILIDNWSLNDISLNVNRIKSLYYLYEHDKEGIEQIFNEYLSSQDAEITAEALFHLGLIDMQKGLLSPDKTSSIIALEKSRTRFYLADHSIENRVDARVFNKIIDLTIDVLKNVTYSLKEGLKEIADLLFKVEGFSFNFKNGPFYIGFYRVLEGLSNISNQNPRNWLDYRFELSSLFHQYAIVQNQEIRDRLSLSKLSASFLEIVNTAFFEPFFLLNFSADQSRIAARLSEIPQDTQEAFFLKNLLDLSNADPKKKISFETLKSQLMRLFPLVSEETVAALVAEYSHLDERMQLFKIFSSLSKPSTIQLRDAILRSCLSLQGNRIYYGNYSEDDRNTFIASLLESAGYHIKDQTRRSKTQTGKSAGEVDVFIQDIYHNPITLIEALNLASVSKDYIKTHIDKIFTYDANGLSDNYILVYANAPNFSKFYNNYRNFVKGHNFKYPLVNLKEDSKIPYSELKKFTVEHSRNDVKVNMHHIIINLYDKK